MTSFWYPLIIIGHLIGMVAWVAGLVGVAALVRAHGGADAASRPGLVAAARKLALLMEIGAMLAIGLGLYLAFRSPMYPATAFKSGGWLHAKLLLVVVGLLVPHVLLRITLGKQRRGEAKAAPGWLLPVVLVSAAACITLGSHPTLLRKAPAASAP